MSSTKVSIPDLTAAELLRFNAKINYSGIDEHGVYHEFNGTPCHIWTAARHNHGYGLFTVGFKRLRTHRQLRASRIMFKMFWGYDPGVNQVCHDCNYPPCVNPVHIYEGDETGKINMQQASRDGRIRNQFEVNPFTEAEIIQIRHDFTTKTSTPLQLAAQFDTTASRIHRAIHGLTYTTSPGAVIAPNPEWQHQSNNPAAKLTETDIPTVWMLFLDNQLPKLVIGQRLGVSHAAIRSVLFGRSWIDASTIFLLTRNLTLAQGIELARGTFTVSRKRRRIF